VAFTAACVALATISAVTGPHASDAAERVSVVLYSNEARFRASVLSAVGRRPAADVARIDWLECSTSAQVIEQIDLGDVDLVILDGESQPTGGMGLARQFKYEIDDCPPVLVVVARKDDRWLAAWSLADAVISAPLDPVEAAAVVAEQLRGRRAGVPVVR
jgi:DNA-binding NarL/FixJ family response regulator